MRIRRKESSWRPSIEELEQVIEKWAPEKYRPERKHLYDEVKARRIAAEFLFAVQTAHGFCFADTNSRNWNKLYWKKRARIEKQIEEIRSDPLVLRLDSPIFRAVGLPCPHGYDDRLECEQIRANLAIYQKPLPSSGPPNSVIEAAVLR